MARNFSIARNITTTLTRSDTVETLNAFSAAVLALFEASGTYDIGADRVYCQWDGADFNVVIENEALASVAADLAAFKSTIRTGLLTLDEVLALSVDDISVLEQSSVSGANATADGVALTGVTWTSGTQVPALTATGVATVIPVGTGANAIPRRDSSGAMPSPYAADAWDYTWDASDGGVVGDWSSTGGGFTVATLGGKTAAQTSTTTNSFGNLVTGEADPTGEFEFRMHFYTTALSEADGTPLSIAEFRAMGRRISFMVIAATGLAIYNSTVPSAFKTGEVLSTWLTLTCRVSGTNGTNATASFWVGEVFLGTVRLSAMGSTTDASTFRLGNSASGTPGNTGLAWVAYRAGHNDAPPDYTYRGLGYASNATL